MEAEREADVALKAVASSFALNCPPRDQFSHCPQSIAIAHVLMASMFFYMASELAPPHTHSKFVNLVYLILFALGVTTSSLAELIEGLADSGGVQMISNVSDADGR